MSVGGKHKLQATSSDSPLNFARWWGGSSTFRTFRMSASRAPVVAHPFFRLSLKKGSPSMRRLLGDEGCHSGLSCALVFFGTGFERYFGKFGSIVGTVSDRRTGLL